MNGEATTPDLPRLPPGLTDAYEQLRPIATGSARRDTNRQGLGILIRSGMAAWMHACAAVAPSAAPPSLTPGGDAEGVLLPVHRDVVDVLAAMALTNTPEVMT